MNHVRNQLESMDAPRSQSDASSSVGVYACPTHPTVTSERPGTCPRCGMALEPARGRANSLRQVARGRLAFWGGIITALAVVLFFLLTEHSAHLLGALPWLVLVLCPVAMYLMMRGHPESGHGARGGRP